MKILNKIIIWLFERYAQTDWVIMHQEKIDKEMMEKYKLKDKSELDQVYSDMHNEPLREAYHSGKEDGYAQAMEEK